MINTKTLLNKMRRSTIMYSGGGNTQESILEMEQKKNT